MYLMRFDHHANIILSYVLEYTYIVHSAEDSQTDLGQQTDAYSAYRQAYTSVEDSRRTWFNKTYPHSAYRQAYLEYVSCAHST